MYADFTYYTETYQSSIIPDENNFKWYARKATLFIELKTHQRANDYVEDNKVKDCTCSLAEYLYQDRVHGEDSNVQSEKVGEWTRTFKINTEKERQSNMHAIVVEHLAITGMLYAGVY